MMGTQKTTFGIDGISQMCRLLLVATVLLGTSFYMKCCVSAFTTTSIATIAKIRKSSYADDGHSNNHCLYLFGGGKKNEKRSFIPELPGNPFENVPSFFGGSDSSQSLDENELPTQFEPTPAGLIFQAKRLVACDLGLLDPTLLDDASFRWIDANSPAAVALSKTEYVAAGRFFNIRGAFPDIDYRAHDYRFVAPDTVRLTRRVLGTMRGELRLRSGSVPPSGLAMKCPPEAVSISFDVDSGKVTKLCTGFVLDRLVGNTAGTAGVVAASVIAGKPAVSDWDLYPPTTIFSRIFARPAKQMEDAESFLAPFPEQVMIQLAKGVLSSNMGADDPSLLSDLEFTFVTPTVGPIRKRDFLQKYAAEEFRDIVDPQFSAFRVDPYDPVRVWVDLQPLAPGYVGPPQAMSLAFDDDGFCTRITSWAIMDPSIGNSGGLGGPDGFKYATGSPSNSLASRSLSSIFGRFKKRALSPITGISVDEYSPISSKAASFKPPKAPKAEPSPPITPPVVAADKDEPSFYRQDAADAVMKRLESLRDMSASIRIIPPTIPTIPVKSPQAPTSTKSADEDAKVKAQKLAAAEKAKQQSQLEAQKAAAEAARRKQQEKAQFEAKKAAAEEARRKQQTDVKKVADEKKAKLDAQKAAATADETRRKQRIQEQKAAAAADEAARKKQIEVERAADEAARKKQIQVERAAAEKESARRKKLEAQKAAEEAERKKRQEQQARDRRAKDRIAAVKAKIAQNPASEAEQKIRQQAALSSLAKAASRATISLFGLGGRQSDDDDDGISAPPSSVKVSSSPSKQVSPPKAKAVAPSGVPSLSRWRRNPDNSITGLVRGSKGFTDGSRITTSPIQSGTISSGEVVKTGSGSRYFLD